MKVGQTTSGMILIYLHPNRCHQRLLLKAHAERGDNLTVTMRWTGREAATITGVVVNDDAQEAAAAA